MHCAELLSKYMYENRMTQQMLAERVGVTRQTIALWATGKTLPKGKNLKRLADTIGVSESEILFGESNVIPLHAEEPEYSGFIAVREFSFTASAGIGSEPTWDQVEESEPAFYREDFFVKHGIKAKRCRRIKVRGDSMSPTIEDGDTVLFEDRYPISLSEIRDGGIYVFSTEFGLRIKRLYRSKQTLIAHSDNTSQYKEEEYSGEEMNSIKVFGEVIEVSRTFK